MIKKLSLFHTLQKIIAIALPLSAGRLLHIIGSFIAMMMVGQLGKEQLAAGFLAISSTTTILTLTLTIFYAIGIQIRYSRGQNKPPEAIGSLVKNGFLLAIILAIPAALIIGYMDKMLLLIGQEPHLVFLTTDYFRYAGLGMFPLLTMMVIGQFYVGIGKTKFVLIIEVISLPLTILSSYGLVLGHFGLPKLGLSGVSLASFFSQFLVLIGAFIVLYFSKNNQPYQLFKKPFLLNWQICRSILSLGLPIGIQFGGELGAMAVAGYLMGYFGVDALAALQITSQYSIIIIMLSFGLTQSLSLMISETYGKRENNDYTIKKYIQASILILLLYIVPVTLLFCTLSTEFAEYYLGKNHLKPDFLYLIRVFFSLSAVFLFFDGMRNLLSGALRGLHDSKTATRINLLSMWVISLPISYLAAFLFNGGPIALRVGFLSGFLIAVILLARHLSKKLALANNSPSFMNHTNSPLTSS